MHRWWVFLHVAGAFGFLTAHGVSVYATFRLRSEREAARVSHLLELWAASIPPMWTALGVLLLGGIVAGFTGHFWGQAWIWAAIVVLVAVIAAMYAVATPWVKRLRTISAAMAERTEALSQEQYEEILRSRRPLVIAAIGFAGLLLILYLMMFQPALGSGDDPCVKDRPISRAVHVCAANELAFDRATLDAPAGERFDLVFDNQDDGVPHNVAIYTDESAEESLFVGDLVDGPTTVTYDVPALDAGSYYFRCDVHPQMDGTMEAV